MAARAIVVPSLPAPTMPRRRSTVSLRDMSFGAVRGPLTGRYRPDAGMVEQLPDAGDHLPPVQGDHLHPLLVGHRSSGVGQVEASESEQSNVRRELGRDGFG